MSELALKFAAISFVFGMLGFAIRHRAPRWGRFLIGLMIFGIATWLLVSTIELYYAGQAHVISRHYGTFKKSDAPDTFQTSVWFHGILGLFLGALGIYIMVSAYFKRNVTFYK